MSPTTALRLTGADALALLHRISTQALADLAPGQARPTLFCDFRGRLLHRAVVAVTSDGAVWLVRDDAPGASLAAFLDRHVFRDDVRIEDRSGTLRVGRAPDADGITAGSISERDRVPVVLHPADGETLVVSADAGAGAVPDSDDRDRIRSGRPAHGHEIVEAFTPFEVGLARDVHLDKGCFTGQEVLMRLVTYDSVKRRLVRVAGAGAPPAVPCDLTVDGQPAGVLTSAMAADMGWIGLGVLRNEVCEPARALALPDGRTTAPVEPLPLTRALGRP